MTRLLAQLRLTQSQKDFVFNVSITPSSTANYVIDILWVCHKSSEKKCIPAVSKAAKQPTQMYMFSHIDHEAVINWFLFGATSMVDTINKNVYVCALAAGLVPIANCTAQQTSEQLTESNRNWTKCAGIAQLSTTFPIFSWDTQHLLHSHWKMSMRWTMEHPNSVLAQVFHLYMLVWAGYVCDASLEWQTPTGLWESETVASKELWSHWDWVVNHFPGCHLKLVYHWKAWRTTTYY